MLEPPRVSPARGPSVDWCELMQSDGAGEFEQASPDDLPLIDIHHRSLPRLCPSRHDKRVAALNASRKWFVLMAEFSAWSRPFSTFYAVHQASESATWGEKEPKPTVRLLSMGERLKKGR